MPEEAWLANDPDTENWWNPHGSSSRAPSLCWPSSARRIPRSIQSRGRHAYREALERAGNPNSRVELIPGVNHAMILGDRLYLKSDKW